VNIHVMGFASSAHATLAKLGHVQMGVLVNAWLITWDWITEPKRPPEKIMAILSARRSRKSVCDLMELVILRTASNAGEMAYYANRRKHLVCKAQCYGNIITCGFVSGHDLWLSGRQVSELKISVNDAANEEIITWREPQEIVLKDNRIVGMRLGRLGQYRRPRTQPLDPVIELSYRSLDCMVPTGGN
jgi:hypothetical protein